MTPPEVGEEIRKLVRQYKRTGKIETSRATYHPESLKEAVKQASAIAYGKHGIGRAGGKQARILRRPRGSEPFTKAEIQTGYRCIPAKLEDFQRAKRGGI